MGVMQENEQRHDLKYADDLTPEQQKRADKLSSGVWDKTFFGGALAVVLISFGSLPFANILPVPLKVVILTAASGAFLLTCFSIGQGAKARKRKFWESQQGENSGDGVL